MAVYAAMVDNVDQNVGRLVDELRAMGELDNTIILFTSDNGASREGEVEGTTGYYVHLLGETDVAADLARLDEIGGPTTIPHYPRGWAMACNTPFRLYKINTHAGGHQVSTLLSWPARFGGDGELRRQYLHVTDVMPTLLDLAGIDAPRTRDGVELLPLAGASFAATIDDAAAVSQHTEQYYEMLGHRGYYREGKEIVSLHLPLTEFGDHEFELYDLDADPTETQRPRRRASPTWSPSCRPRGTRRRGTTRSSRSTRAVASSTSTGPDGSRTRSTATSPSGPEHRRSNGGGHSGWC